MNKIEQAIADEIISQMEGHSGEFGVELEIDDYAIYVYGVYEKYGHHQWDYEFGSGEWVADSAWCNILQTETYDKDGFLVRNPFFTSEVESIVEQNFK